ncbi:hypothetical protein PMY12_18535 [Clostridium tertium]|uniref:hypothetical protein n=1 Tax=Clostridium tertium TaxID=1559 RepID=UPI00232BE341|nr:hypothetical protein [Clostridium tertium]MDB1935273.1 hypothetical protein [Clostridium tertium]MDB1939007.1 hypothetical protein [Clostridium tertium]
MINIDDYLNIGVEVKINGEVIEVLQPTAKMTKEINKMEKEMTEENYLEIKSKVALMILNNNKQKKIFKDNDIDNIPYKLQDFIIKEIMKLVYKADNDPN